MTTTCLPTSTGKLVGFEFKVDLSGRDYQVKRIEGKDAFIQQLANATPMMQKLLDEVLSDDRVLDADRRRAAR